MNLNRFFVYVILVTLGFGSLWLNQILSVYLGISLAIFMILAMESLFEGDKDESKTKNM